MTNVLVNQNPHEISPDTTLAELLAQCDCKPPFAVALNLRFIPRSQYAQTYLHDGDTIEIVHPVVGG